MLTTDLLTSRQSPQNASLIDSSYISVRPISVTARRLLLQRRWRSRSDRKSRLPGRLSGRPGHLSHTNQLPSSLSVLSSLFSKCYATGWVTHGIVKDDVFSRLSWATVRQHLIQDALVMSVFGTSTGWVYNYWFRQPPVQDSCISEVV